MLVASMLFQDLLFANPELKTPVLPKPALTIEESIGTIQEVWNGEGGVVIYLLQDAHTNESAQRNIAAILDTLTEKEKIKTVFLEAGTGDDSLSDLRPLAPLEKRKAVADIYLRRAHIQGPDYFDLTGEKEIKLWGVEDKTLYYRGIDLYRSLKAGREGANAWLDKLERAIKTLKSKLFNLALAEFDAAHQAHLKEGLGLVDYLRLLCELSQKSGIDTSFLQNIRILKEVREKESSIDFEKPKDADLERYVDYLGLAKKIKAEGLLEEIAWLEERLYDALSRTADEKELVRASKAGETLRRLVNLKATSSDLASIGSDPSAFEAQELGGFVNVKIMELERHYEDAVFLDKGYQGSFDDAKAFYALTKERDEIFVKNILTKMDETKETKAAFVSGGFHTENLKKLLKEKNVSYVSIIPRVAQETNQRRYEELLMGQGPVLPLATLPAKLLNTPPGAEIVVHGARVTAMLEKDLIFSPIPVSVGSRASKGEIKEPLRIVKEALRVSDDSLESSQRIVEAASEWLHAMGSPFARIVRPYAEKIRHAGLIPEEQPIMMSKSHELGGDVQIQINPVAINRLSQSILNGASTWRMAEFVFSAEIVPIVVREATGFAFLSAAATYTSFVQERRDFFEVFREKMFGFQGTFLRIYDPIRLFAANGELIMKLAANAFSGEFVERRAQRDAARWATSNNANRSYYYLLDPSRFLSLDEDETFRSEIADTMIHVVNAHLQGKMNSELEPAFYMAFLAYQAHLWQASGGKEGLDNATLVKIMEGAPVSHVELRSVAGSLYPYVMSIVTPMEPLIERWLNEQPNGARLIRKPGGQTRTDLRFITDHVAERVALADSFMRELENDPILAPILRREPLLMEGLKLIKNARHGNIWARMDQEHTGNVYKLNDRFMYLADEARMLIKLNRLGLLGIPLVLSIGVTDHTLPNAWLFMQGIADAVDFHSTRFITASPVMKLDHLIGIALTLKGAHEHGVVHNDFKPANWLLGPLGETSLIDWEIATPIGDEQPAGPSLYRASNFWFGKARTVDTDVHSFGVSIRELMEYGEKGLDPAPQKRLMHLVKRMRWNGSWFVRGVYRSAKSIGVDLPDWKPLRMSEVVKELEAIREAQKVGARTSDDETGASPLGTHELKDRRNAVSKPVLLMFIQDALWLNMFIGMTNWANYFSGGKNLYSVLMGLSSATLMIFVFRPIVYRNQRQAIKALGDTGYFGSTVMIDILRVMLSTTDPVSRKLGAEALGEIGDKRALPILQDLTATPVPYVKKAVIAAIKKIESSGARVALVTVVKDLLGWSDGTAAGKAIWQEIKTGTWPTKPIPRGDEDFFSWGGAWVYDGMAFVDVFRDIYSGDRYIRHDYPQEAYIVPAAAIDTAFKGASYFKLSGTQYKQLMSYLLTRPDRFMGRALPGTFRASFETEEVLPDKYWPNFYARDTAVLRSNRRMYPYTARLIANAIRIIASSGKKDFKIYHQGSGDGRLLGYLKTELREQFPEYTFGLFGVDKQAEAIRKATGQSPDKEILIRDGLVESTEHFRSEAPEGFDIILDYGVTVGSVLNREQATSVYQGWSERLVPGGLVVSIPYATKHLWADRIPIPADLKPLSFTDPRNIFHKVRPGVVMLLQKEGGVPMTAEQLISSGARAADVEADALVDVLMREGRVKLTVPGGEPLDVRYYYQEKQIRKPGGWLDEFSGGQHISPRFRIEISRHSKRIGYVDVKVLGERALIDHGFHPHDLSELDSGAAVQMVDKSYRTAIHVEDEHLKRGIGQALMALALRVSQRLGAERLDAESIRTESIGFFEKIGGRRELHDRVLLDGSIHTNAPRVTWDLTAGTLPPVEVNASSGARTADGTESFNKARELAYQISLKSMEIMNVVARQDLRSLSEDLIEGRPMIYPSSIETFLDETAVELVAMLEDPVRAQELQAVASTLLNERSRNEVVLNGTPEEWLTHVAFYLSELGEGIVKILEAKLGSDKHAQVLRALGVMVKEGSVSPSQENYHVDVAAVQALNVLEEAAQKGDKEAMAMIEGLTGTAGLSEATIQLLFRQGSSLEVRAWAFSALAIFLRGTQKLGTDDLMIMKARAAAPEIHKIVSSLTGMATNTSGVPEGTPRGLRKEYLIAAEVAIYEIALEVQTPQELKTRLKFYLKNGLIRSFGWGKDLRQELAQNLTLMRNPSIPLSGDRPVAVVIINNEDHNAHWMTSDGYLHDLMEQGYLVVYREVAGLDEGLIFLRAITARRKALNLTVIDHGTASNFNMRKPKALTTLANLEWTRDEKLQTTEILKRRFSGSLALGADVVVLTCDAGGHDDYQMNMVDFMQMVFPNATTVGPKGIVSHAVVNRHQTGADHVTFYGPKGEVIPSYYSSQVVPANVWLTSDSVTSPSDTISSSAGARVSKWALAFAAVIGTLFNHHVGPNKPEREALMPPRISHDIELISDSIEREPAPDMSAEEERIVQTAMNGGNHFIKLYEVSKDPQDRKESVRYYLRGFLFKAAFLDMPNSFANNPHDHRKASAEVSAYLREMADDAKFVALPDQIRELRGLAEEFRIISLRPNPFRIDKLSYILRQHAILGLANRIPVKALPQAARPPNGARLLEKAKIEGLVRTALKYSKFVVGAVAFAGTMDAFGIHDVMATPSGFAFVAAVVIGPVKPIALAFFLGYQAHKYLTRSKGARFSTPFKPGINRLTLGMWLIDSDLRKTLTELIKLTNPDSISSAKRVMTYVLAKDIFSGLSRVYMKDDKVVGVVVTAKKISLNIASRKDGFHRLLVMLLAVDPSFRQQGIGTELLVSLAQEAQKQKQRHIDLYVDLANTSAIDFYKKLGFKPFTRPVSMGTYQMQNYRVSIAKLLGYPKQAAVETRPLEAVAGARLEMPYPREKVLASLEVKRFDYPVAVLIEANLREAIESQANRGPLDLSIYADIIEQLEPESVSPTLYEAAFYLRTIGFFGVGFTGALVTTLVAFTNVPQFHFAVQVPAKAILLYGFYHLLRLIFRLEKRFVLKNRRGFYPVPNTHNNLWIQEKMSAIVRYEVKLHAKYTVGARLLDGTPVTFKVFSSLPASERQGSEMKEVLDWWKDTPWGRYAVEDRLKPSNYDALVAYAHDRPVGMYVYQLHPSLPNAQFLHHKERAEDKGVFVKIPGQGLGTVLREELLRRLKAEGYQYFSISTPEDDDSALAFAEALSRNDFVNTVRDASGKILRQTVALDRFGTRVASSYPAHVMSDGRITLPTSLFPGYREHRFYIGKEHREKYIRLKFLPGENDLTAGFIAYVDGIPTHIYYAADDQPQPLKLFYSTDRAGRIAMREPKKYGYTTDRFVIGPDHRNKRVVVYPLRDHDFKTGFKIYDASVPHGKKLAEYDAQNDLWTRFRVSRKIDDKKRIQINHDYMHFKEGNKGDRVFFDKREHLATHTIWFQLRSSGARLRDSGEHLTGLRQQLRFESRFSKYKDLLVARLGKETGEWLSWQMGFARMQITESRDLREGELARLAAQVQDGKKNVPTDVIRSPLTILPLNAQSTDENFAVFYSALFYFSAMTNLVLWNVMSAAGEKVGNLYTLDDIRSLTEHNFFHSLSALRLAHNAERLKIDEAVWMKYAQAAIEALAKGFILPAGLLDRRLRVSDTIPNVLNKGSELEADYQRMMEALKPAVSLKWFGKSAITASTDPQVLKKVIEKVFENPGFLLSDNFTVKVAATEPVQVEKWQEEAIRASLEKAKIAEKAGPDAIAAIYLSISSKVQVAVDFLRDWFDISPDAARKLYHDMKEGLKLKNKYRHMIVQQLPDSPQRERLLTFMDSFELNVEESKKVGIQWESDPPRGRIVSAKLTFDTNEDPLMTFVYLLTRLEVVARILAMRQYKTVEIEKLEKLEYSHILASLLLTKRGVELGFDKEKVALTGVEALGAFADKFLTKEAGLPIAVKITAALRPDSALAAEWDVYARILGTLPARPGHGDSFLSDYEAVSKASAWADNLDLFPAALQRFFSGIDEDTQLPPWAILKTGSEAMPVVVPPATSPTQTPQEPPKEDPPAPEPPKTPPIDTPQAPPVVPALRREWMLEWHHRALKQALHARFPEKSFAVSQLEKAYELVVPDYHDKISGKDRRKRLGKLFEISNRQGEDLYGELKAYMALDPVLMMAKEGKRYAQIVSAYRREDDWFKSEPPFSLAQELVRFEYLRDQAGFDPEKAKQLREYEEHFDREDIQQELAESMNFDFDDYVEAEEKDVELGSKMIKLLDTPHGDDAKAVVLTIYVADGEHKARLDDVEELRYIPDFEDPALDTVYVKVADGKTFQIRAGGTVTTAEGARVVEASGERLLSSLKAAKNAGISDAALRYAVTEGRLKDGADDFWIGKRGNEDYWHYVFKEKRVLRWERLLKMLIVDAKLNRHHTIEMINIIDENVPATPEDVERTDAKIRQIAVEKFDWAYKIGVALKTRKDRGETPTIEQVAADAGAAPQLISRLKQRPEIHRLFDEVGAVSKPKRDADHRITNRLLSFVKALILRVKESPFTAGDYWNEIVSFDKKLQDALNVVVSVRDKRTIVRSITLLERIKKSDKQDVFIGALEAIRYRMEKKEAPPQRRSKPQRSLARYLAEHDSPDRAYENRAGNDVGIIGIHVSNLRRIPSRRKLYAEAIRASAQRLMLFLEQFQADGSFHQFEFVRSQLFGPANAVYTKALAMSHAEHISEADIEAMYHVNEALTKAYSGTLLQLRQAVRVAGSRAANSFEKLAGMFGLDRSLPAEQLQLLTDKEITAYTNRFVRLLSRKAPREIAEEIVQNAWIKVLNTGTFHHQAKFSTWMYSIVWRTYLDWYRSRKNENQHLDRDVDVNEVLEWVEARPDSRPDVLYRTKTERKRLWETLHRRLGPKYARMMVLRYGYGMSYEEIAEATGLPVTTVKTRINKAKENFVAAGPNRTSGGGFSDLSAPRKRSRIVALHRPVQERWKKRLAWQVYLPTPQDMTYMMFRSLKNQGHMGPETRFADLGSGDGSVVHMANAITGADSTGFDRSAEMIQDVDALTEQLSKEGIVEKDKVHWVSGDYNDQDLSKYDILYLYATVSGYDRRIGDRMRPGAMLIIINLPGYTPPGFERIKDFLPKEGSNLWRAYRRTSGSRAAPEYKYSLTSMRGMLLQLFQDHYDGLLGYLAIREKDLADKDHRLKSFTNGHPGAAHTTRYALTTRRGRRYVFFLKTVEPSKANSISDAAVYLRNQEQNENIARLVGVAMSAKFFMVGEKPMLVVQDSIGRPLRRQTRSPKMARAIGYALGKLHGADILHGDADREHAFVDNVYVKRNGRNIVHVKFIDFGSSKDFRTDKVMVERSAKEEGFRDFTFDFEKKTYKAWLIEEHLDPFFELGYRKGLTEGKRLRDSMSNGHDGARISHHRTSVGLLLKTANEGGIVRMDDAFAPINSIRAIGLLDFKRSGRFAPHDGKLFPVGSAQEILLYLDGVPLETKVFVAVADDALVASREVVQVKNGHVLHFFQHPRHSLRIGRVDPLVGSVEISYFGPGRVIKVVGSVSRPIAERKNIILGQWDSLTIEGFSLKLIKFDGDAALISLKEPLNLPLNLEISTSNGKSGSAQIQNPKRGLRVEGARAASPYDSTYAAFLRTFAKNGQIYHNTRLGSVWMMLFNSGGNMNRSTWFSNRKTTMGAGIGMGSSLLRVVHTPKVTLALDVDKLIEQRIPFGEDNGIYSMAPVPLSTMTDESKKEIVGLLLNLGKNDPLFPIQEKDILAKGLGFDDWNELNAVLKIDPAGARAAIKPELIAKFKEFNIDVMPDGTVSFDRVPMGADAPDWVMDEIRPYDKDKKGHIYTEIADMPRMELVGVEDIMELPRLDRVLPFRTSEGVFLGLVRRSTDGKTVPAAIKLFGNRYNPATQNPKYTDEHILNELISAQAHGFIGWTPDFYGALIGTKHVTAYAMQLAIKTQDVDGSDIEDLDPEMGDITADIEIDTGLERPTDGMLTRADKYIYNDPANTVMHGSAYHYPRLMSFVARVNTSGARVINPILTTSSAPVHIPDSEERVFTTFMRHRTEKGGDYSQLMFSMFRDHLGGLIFGGNKSQWPIRILSAGSSNGLETWSTIVSLIEGGGNWPGTFEVVGVDKDPAMVRKAQEGEYFDVELDFYGQGWPYLPYFFDKTGLETYRVKDFLRGYARFIIADLTELPALQPLGLFHGVSFLNASYQLTPEQRRLAIDNLAAVTHPGSILLFDDSHMDLEAQEYLSTPEVYIKDQDGKFRNVDGARAAERVITPEHVESFAALLKEHFKGKADIQVYDFGAGWGDRMSRFGQWLQKSFSVVRIVGFDESLVATALAREKGHDVHTFRIDETSVEDLPKADIITMFLPFPDKLAGILAAAKKTIKPDGLIIIQMSFVDFDDMIDNGDYDDAWEAVRNLRLIQIDGEHWDYSTKNALIFAYSPLWAQGARSPEVPELLIGRYGSDVAQRAVRELKQYLNEADLKKVMDVWIANSRIYVGENSFDRDEANLFRIGEDAIAAMTIVAGAANVSNNTKFIIMESLVQQSFGAALMLKGASDTARLTRLNEGHTKMLQLQTEFGERRTPEGARLTSLFTMTRQKVASFFIGVAMAASPSLVHATVPVKGLGNFDMLRQNNELSVKAQAPENLSVDLRELHFDLSPKAIVERRLAESMMVSTVNGRSMTEIRADVDGEDERLEMALQVAGIPTDTKVVVKVDDSATGVYSENFWAEVRNLNDKNALFIKQGEPVPAAFLGVPVVYMYAPGNAAAIRDHIHFPVDPRAAAYKSTLRLAAATGRIGNNNIPDSYLIDYSERTGENLSLETLLGIREGRLLITIRPILDVNDEIRYFELRLRQLTQSA